MPVSNERTPIAPARSNHIARREHLFFSWMAVAAALAVFGGFARTWFLKPWTGTPSLPLIVHIHAAVFTAWMLLFIIQTAFVARHRLGAHRRLGIAGGALAVVMVVLGCVIAISGARRGFMGQFPDEPAGFADALSFLTLGLGDMLLFAVFVSAALYYRRNRQAHKR